MKHFTFPCVSRKNHDAEVEKLEARIRELENKNEVNKRKVAEFEAAQAGECVPSDRCKGCSHALEIIEFYGFGSPYNRTVCELRMPQCPHYERKDKEAK